MTLVEPYFMKNKDWYYYDVKELKYKLTKLAPPLAVINYHKFYEALGSQKESTK